MTINGTVITIVGNYDSPWLSGKQLCSALGYQHPKQTLFDNVKSKHKTTLDELKKLVNAQLTDFFWPFSHELSYHDGKAVYISEHGAYHLAMKCQLPIGEEFRDWLAEEVIPSIRKTGQYRLEKSFQEQLAIKDKEVEKLKEKVAVMTKNNKTKHVFQVYKHVTEPTKYHFIRVQKRNFNNAIKAINAEEYEIILNEGDVPNSINIPNRLKEKLVELNVSFVLQKHVNCRCKRARNCLRLNRRISGVICFNSSVGIKIKL